MSRLALALAAVFAAVSFAAKPAAVKPTFTMPTPEGWRTETIPFPLDFAPELKYTGLEELRFAPGMFKQGAEDFWSYSFVWSINEKLGLEPTRLAADLEVYFRGLGAAVRKSGKLPPLKMILPAKLIPEGDRLTGTAVAFDAFVTQRLVALNVRVQLVEAPSGRGAALYFSLSPQPFDHAIWKTLDAIGSGFQSAKVQG